MVNKTIIEVINMHPSLNSDRLYVAVDILLLSQTGNALKLLLSRRPSPPYQGALALPGRLVAVDHSAEETVDALLSEMLPKTIPSSGVYREQLFTFSEPKRDLRGRVISIAYLAIIPWQQLAPALEETQTDFKCFTVSGSDKGLQLSGSDGSAIDCSALAFDHADIIRTGVARLKGKIEYTEIGFHFLNDPEAFSLGDMQRVFEAVLGRTLDASNFRRFALNRYEETGKIEQTERAEKKKRGRPATLYRLKP